MSKSRSNRSTPALVRPAPIDAIRARLRELEAARDQLILTFREQLYGHDAAIGELNALVESIDGTAPTETSHAVPPEPSV
jgi:hypothetical protein